MLKNFGLESVFKKERGKLFQAYENKTEERIYGSLPNGVINKRAGRKPVHERHGIGNYHYLSDDQRPYYYMEERHYFQAFRSHHPAECAIKKVHREEKI